MTSRKTSPKATPPAWANRFLEWYCADDLLDEIQGDLLEIYEHRVEAKGQRKANWLFIKEVLLFFRPSSFKKKNPFENLPIMLSLFHNYFKTAARNLWKTKYFSSLNLIGLTAGFCSFLFIALYIQYELSFDQHHEKSERIYRIAQVQKGNTFRGTDRFALAPSGLGPAVVEDFPEVEAVSTLRTDEYLFQKDNRAFYERGLFCDPFVFDVFSLEILKGNARAAIKDPSSIMLTESFARKYYANEDPIGQVLKMEGKKLLTVQGIVKDPPLNSHFTFEYITSIENARYYRPGNWDSNSYYAYAVLKQGTDPNVLQRKFVALDQKYLESDETSSVTSSKFFLQPLKDIHLRSKLNFEIAPTGDIRYLYLFGSIAIIILLIAMINYLNFAIADSERRATEVGMRKTLGARRSQLIQQFLGESLLLTLLSFIVAVLLVLIYLPVLNTYLEQEISFSFRDNWQLIGWLLLMVCFIGIASGIYPAVFISKVRPIKALTGNIIGVYQKSSLLRNASVTGQFIAAIILAIGSLVVLQQLKYIQNKQLGYNEEQVLFIPYAEGEVHEQEAVIRSTLLQNPHIKKVAFSKAVPLNMYGSSKISAFEGSTGDENFSSYRNAIDYNFIDLYDMEIIDGQSFAKKPSTDSLPTYILNETAVKTLGWKTPIGKNFNNGRVIGVVKDFHFQPFHLSIEPLYFRLASAEDLSYFGNISLKIDGQNRKQTLDYIAASMKAILPTIPLDYQFLDEALQKLYQKERQLGRMFTVFTGLAVLIALLGLLGLASYNVVRRAKEISIRKVLGASASGIIRMLFKDYLRLIIVALVFAIPMAYYLMQRWLDNFAYRINLAWHWQLFALIGLVALILPLIIISLQSIRSARANPAEQLRT